jgi:hypothetical protein
MIEPQELLMPHTDGLDTTAIRSAGGVGIHVIIGRNNAGKTRLLRALMGSGLAATVDAGTLARVRKFDHAMLNTEWATIGTVRVTWPRTLSPPGRPDFDVNDPPGDLRIDETSTADIRARKPGLEGRFWDFVRGEIWPLLRLRPAREVPTDRYMEQEAPLVSSATIESPSRWASLLGNLERSEADSERERFAAIDAALAEITEGLRLRSLGTSGRSVMHIAEPGLGPRPLDLCGAGLRDLVGILMFVFMFPEPDLMLDDPGIRLHPHAQRRLLQFLNEQAKLRAIWIATHEGAFVGAPMVRRRFYVFREREKDRSFVRELADAEELRQAQADLGWLPADAFLADHVLMCEGPSDKTAFQAAIQWLAERDFTRAGTVVAELGGDGKVWGDPAELKRRVALANDIAPYASHTVLVDRGGKTERQVTTLRANVQASGARLMLLDRNELENYFLAPPLVRAILLSLAEEASAIRGEEVAAPSLDRVQELLAEHGGEPKGSAILERVAGAAGLAYRKTDGARIAISYIRDLSPDDANALMADVEVALRQPG